MASIALQTRKWANLNQKAYFYDKKMSKKIITLDGLHGLFIY